MKKWTISLDDGTRQIINNRMLTEINQFFIIHINYLILDYATDYKSIEYKINAKMFRPYITDEHLYTDEQIKQFTNYKLTDIILKSGLYLKLNLKFGDVLRWHDEEYRNAGRLFWRENGLCNFYVGFDGYGSVWPDMTANSVNSSVFYEDTANGHGDIIPFDHSDYKVQGEILSLPHESEIYHVAILVNYMDEDDKWFIISYYKDRLDIYKDINPQSDNIRWYIVPCTSLFGGPNTFFKDHNFMPRHRSLDFMDNP